MSAQHAIWTRQELILAFSAYCRSPFGQIHMRIARIIGLAKLLGRSRGSVGLEHFNFARLDPALQARRYCCRINLHPTPNS
jgi:putative restriction endonuclease